MNIPTCYRCPLRLTPAPTRDDPFKRIRCTKLQAKLDSVKRAGLTSISFRCDIRGMLYGPGEVVTFQLWVKDIDPDERIAGHYQDCTGIVMRTKGRKLLVYCEQSERNPIWIRDDANKTHVKVAACIHCGKPIGKELKTKDGDPWECRREYDPEQPLLGALDCEASA